MTVPESITLDDPAFPHGTLRGYRGARSRPACGCDRCRSANTTWQRRYDAAYVARLRGEREPVTDGPDTDTAGRVRLVHPDPPGGHGSITAATRVHCGCAACRTADNARQRAARARRRSHPPGA